MAYANTNGIRIRYQVEGEGEPLLLHHGLSERLETWYRKGFVEALAGRYRLVMLDARGHGESDKPHDVSAYTLEERVADVVAVLDAEGIEQAHFFGYSLGGWTGFGLAKHMPERLLSLAVGGATPYGQDMAPIRALLKGDLETALATLERVAGVTATPELRAGFLANDVEALRASHAEDRPPIPEVVAGITVPCLLFSGSEDPLHAEMERCAGELRQARFVSLAEMNHFQAGLGLAAVLPAVQAFLPGSSSPFAIWRQQSLAVMGAARRPRRRSQHLASQRSNAR